MRISTWLRRKRLAAAAATLVAAQLALVAVVASAGGTPLWQLEVAKIPTAKYMRDAKVYVTEATQALRPYVGSGLGDSRIDPVLADVDSRYFDGARLNSAANGEIAFDNLQHLESFLKSRLTGASPPNGEAEQAHVRALVETLTGLRLLADAAIQDAEATIGPFRANPPPAPAPAGLAAASADLDAAKLNLAKADEMLSKGNPEPATIQAADAWRDGFNVLALLGITYTGDHDNDGVVDVVELRFGASPLLVDSDGDGLTDKFEITELAGWTMPNKVDTDQDSIADGAEDVDGDGLTNLDEQALGTSPTNPDTDGDGATDGAEVAQGSNPLVVDQPRAPPAPGDLPPYVPNPTLVDTDGDRVPDSTELDNGSDPSKVDTDADGLPDGSELDFLSSPVHQDTDNDGLRDDWEVAHTADGYHPAKFDEQISKWSYVSDFLLGMFAGEFAERDSMAWLAGNMCGGGLSVIPVVGWILGGLADIRDTISALIHADWVSAGLSILGVIPYVGDAVSLPAKVAKFVLKYTHRLMEAARQVAKYDKIPDSVKELTFELIMPVVWSALVAPDAAAVSIAADTRISRRTFTRLLTGKRTDLEKIHFAMQAEGIDGRKLHVDGDKVRWAGNWEDGESILIDDLMLRQGKVGRDHFRLARPDDPRFRGDREADFAEEMPDGWILHEVKTGIPFTDDRVMEQIVQCEKDGWYQRDENQARIHADNPGLSGKRIKKAHWHFVPNGGGGQPPLHDLGLDERLLDCLKRNNIEFTIHFPHD